jgi:hypothetical protein
MERAVLQKRLQMPQLQGDVVLTMPSRTRVSRSFWQNGERVVTFFTRKEHKKMDNAIRRKSKEYLIVPKKLAIERLAKWLHDPPNTLRYEKWEDMPNKPKGPNRWGTRNGDGKACWHEKAKKAIKAMEGKI